MSFSPRSDGYDRLDPVFYISATWGDFLRVIYKMGANPSHLSPIDPLDIGEKRLLNLLKSRLDNVGARWEP